MLHDVCREAGVPSASLWAAVPHYISVSPNPKAALALIDRLGALLETHFQTMELGQAAVRFERQVTSAVASDEDVSTYVRDLEKRMDAGEEPLRDLPTGDELAAELQRFLSDRGTSRTTRRRRSRAQIFVATDLLGPIREHRFDGTDTSARRRTGPPRGSENHAHHLRPF